MIWKAIKTLSWGFLGSSDGKESACSVGDPTQVQSLGQEDPLEKGMTNHSSILARELHGQTMVSQRVGQN